MAKKLVRRVSSYEKPESNRIIGWILHENGTYKAVANEQPMQNALCLVFYLIFLMLCPM